MYIVLIFQTGISRITKYVNCVRVLRMVMYSVSYWISTFILMLLLIISTKIHVQWIFTKSLEHFNYGII